MTIIDVQIACEGDHPTESQFQTWVDTALQKVDKEVVGTADIELSLRLVDEAECAELNLNYRGKTGTTNVLSFPFDSPIPIKPRLLGDLVICTPVVEQEAKQQSKKVDEHWTHLVVHGCLHLLGYDHIEDDEAEIMEALEVTILQSLNIENPYLEKEVLS